MDEPRSPVLASVENFVALDIRVGRITAVEDNARARFPAFVLTIDFGPFGLKTSSAQITANYTKDYLLGRLVVAVVNFPVKLVAGVKSQCLVLAACCETRGIVLLEPASDVALGSRVS